MKAYIYCFVREDISAEQKIVQIGHACYDAGKLIPKSEQTRSPSLILLSAQNEDELLLIAKKISCAGISYSAFYEPDCNRLTGKTMGYSALCTRQVSSLRERSFFKEWKLYRQPSVDML